MPMYESIWLADDDADDCEFFQDVLMQILPRAKLTILSNVSGLMHLFAAGGKPDILFLDMLMPVTNGLNYLTTIREQPQLSNLPIVAFSGSLYAKHIHLAYNSGANLFYTKPATVPELVKGLTALLKLDWSDPATITRAHYINDSFVPFTV